jgi:hypothetical protein
MTTAIPETAGLSPQSDTHNFIVDELFMFGNWQTAGCALDLIDICHDSPYSPLRRVPEMPHSISGWFQSIP